MCFIPQWGERITAHKHRCYESIRHVEFSIQYVGRYRMLALSNELRQNQLSGHN